MSEVSYMPKQEIEAQIEAGNQEVIDKVMANKLIAGEAPKPAEEVKDDKEVHGGSDTVHNGSTVEGAAAQTAPAAETTVAPQETTEGAGTEVAPKVAPEVQEYLTKIQESEEILDNVKKRRLEEKERFLVEQREAQNKMNEYETTVTDLQKRLDDIEKVTKEPKTDTYKPEPIVLNESEEDIDTASVYAVNNRKLIDGLKSELDKAINKTTDVENDPAVQNIVGKLDKIEKADTKRAEDAAIDAEKELQANVKRQLFNDIRTFQSRNEGFQTKKDPEELAGDYRTFRTEVSEFIRSEEPRDINAAIDSLIHGSSDKDEQLRSRAKKEGVEIPEEVKTFMIVSEINDLKNGYQYNNITGKFDPITDSMGRQVRHKSLDEAYKLSNYNNKINEAKRTAARNFQTKMDVRDDSATVLENAQTADDAEQAKFSPAQLEELLKKPEIMYRNNPELAKQVKAAYNQIGIPMPVRGGRL